MAGFTTLAVIMIASAAYAAWQTHEAGQAEEEAGVQRRQASESQAKIQDFNAHIADLQADDAIDRGAEAESAYRTQIKQTIGQQRTAFAASNIDVSFGSAVDVQADAAYLGELDALTIRTNAAREAWGYKVQAVDTRMRAQVSRREGVFLEAQGHQAATTANIAAGGQLIGGGQSLLGARYGWNH